MPKAKAAHGKATKAEEDEGPPSVALLDMYANAAETYRSISLQRGNPAMLSYPNAFGFATSGWEGCVGHGPNARRSPSTSGSSPVYNGAALTAAERVTAVDSVVPSYRDESVVLARHRHREPRYKL